MGKDQKQTEHNTSIQYIPAWLSDHIVSDLVDGYPRDRGGPPAVETAFAGIKWLSRGQLGACISDLFNQRSRTLRPLSEVNIYPCPFW